MRARCFSVVLALAAALTCSGCRAREPGIPFATAPAVGEIGPDRAIVWARAARLPAFLHVELEGLGFSRHVTVPALADLDATARAELRGLPCRELVMTLWLSTSRDATRPLDHVVLDTLTLAPAPHDPAALAFGFGGDLGGQDVCRDRERGYPLAREAADAPLDFFVLIGDTIYADGLCTGRGRYGNAQIPGAFPIARTLEDFRAHYRYAEEDTGFASLRARSFTVWDDHEIANDAGPSSAHEPGAERLLPVGRRALIEHAPLPAALALDRDAPLYRSVRWGRHAEIFFLDTRSYRSANHDSDSAAADKTMLGISQRNWLVAGLVGSNATWRIVVSSVPLSIPHGGDSWADGGTGEGYERELFDILRRVDEGGVHQIVFLTTDVHFATTLRHRPLGELVIYEFVTGPMNAALFPTHDLDPSLSPERLFFHGPDDERAIRSFDEALSFMSWGVVDIDRRGTLTYEVRSIGGRSLYSLSLDP